MIEPLIKKIHNPRASQDLFAAVKGRAYSFFLDSSCDHKKLGAFSFLGCEPFLVFKSKGSRITLEWEDGKTEKFDSDPFAALKDIYVRYNRVSDTGGLPFTSGGVGYFGYDMKRFVEDLPDIAEDDLDIPDCIVGFYDAVTICDNRTGEVYVASSGLPYRDKTKNRSRAKARSEYFINMLTKFPEKAHAPAFLSTPEPVSNFSRRSYSDAVLKAKEYIKRGDIYQVNLSQRFRARLEADPFDIYMRLREYSPAPFSSYLDFKDVIILSSSPERFLLKKGRYIETRPIKGTRPRGADNSSDSILAHELVKSQKDAAEHIMIVDLERNDLGRICEYGSVRLTEPAILEKYSTVFHLVSTVSGRLKKNIDPIDCLMAAFPGGSITGAPKIRAMEIIEELEDVKRSIYTGAIGYISFDGNMDTSIGFSSQCSYL